MRKLRVVTALDCFTFSLLKSSIFIFFALVNHALFLSFSFAQEMPSQLKEIGITEHLGKTVSVDQLTFKDEAGEKVLLAKFFNKKRPVLLTLIYYECPNLCNFLLNGLITTLKALDWSAGKQFDIVTISIDPSESSELAKNKKESYLKIYDRPGASEGWHFLTGEKEQIQRLSKEVGFGYRYEPKDKQYAHSAALFVLTPEAKISRYLYGIEFQKQDLKLSLMEASYGKMGTVVERLLLFCYRYDPETKRYSIYLTKLMQLGSGVTIILFGGYLFLFWRRQRKGA